MEERIKVIYRQLLDRFVKITWTHKVQEIQAGLYLKDAKANKKWMAVLNALTTSSAITTVLADCGLSQIMPIVTAILAVFSSYFTFRYKDSTLESMALENKAFAAKCRHLRNMYESLLADIMSEKEVDYNAIKDRREELECMENDLFTRQIAPHTTKKAVSLAEKALKENRESQTEQSEIEAIVPEALQLYKFKL